MVECYILSAAMKKFGMKSLGEASSEKIASADVWLYDRAEREKIISELAKDVVESFTNFSFHTSNQISGDDIIQKHSI